MEGDDKLVEEGRERVALRRDQSARHQGQHAGVGARLDRRGRAPRRQVDQHADHAGGGEEHHQGQDVPGVGDGEGVDGRGEVVVGQEESGGRGQDPRPDPAGGGHHDHQQQVGAEGGGQVGVGPGRGEDPGEEREPDHADEHGGHPAARREGGRAVGGAAGPARLGRVGCVRPAPSAVSRLVGPGRVGGDDVHVECAAGGPDHRVDDRAAHELGHPAAVGGPSTSWVAFSARATCTSAGATSAPTTST